MQIQLWSHLRFKFSKFQNIKYFCLLLKLLRPNLNNSLIFSLLNSRDCVKTKKIIQSPGKKTPYPHLKKGGFACFPLFQRGIKGVFTQSLPLSNALEFRSSATVLQLYSFYLESWSFLTNTVTKQELGNEAIKIHELLSL